MLSALSSLDTFKRIAIEINVFNGYDYRDMDDRNQQTYSRHPPVDGDSNDWFYGKHGIISYTIELGWNQFIPGEAELAGIVAENLGANLVAIEEADHPRRMPVQLNHTSLEDTSSTGGREVTVRVSEGEIIPGGLQLYYSVDEGNWKTVTMMADANRGGYAADLPGVPEGSSVQYYFVARSTSQGTSHLPAYGPYESFSYTVAGSGSSVSAASMWPFLLIILVVVVAYVYRRRLMPLANRGLRVVRIRKVPDQ